MLVSGLAQPGARWHRVAALLAEAGHTVVTLDNRGCGATGPCTEAFTLADCAADVLQTADALGLGRFSLAGISMGGMIAQEVLAAAPDRVDAAGLLATTPGGDLTLPPPDPMILMTDDPKVLWTRLTGPGFAEAHPDVIAEEAAVSTAAATPLETVMWQLQAILAFDPADRLDRLDLPVLVIHGDHDPLVPYENGVRLAKKLGVELVTFEGAGHALEFERPAEVAALLARHFAPTERRGRVSG
ncbi:MAG TPA: alpha/beta hydrolase [Acidimicrobiales bacterium]|nr:alpha/beta hydrolase [Acidimicrobiales bacterium]